MNQRPKPGEDEDDLIKLQQQFLSSGGPQISSVSVKRPDKRKTDNKDVVYMEGVELSGNSQYQVKKSKFKGEQDVASQSGISGTNSREKETVEDLERAMDKKDPSVAAVLTSIIERDTRNEIFVAPSLGTQAFPSVRPLNVPLSTKGSKMKKKSLFAQQVESQGSEHFGVDSSCRVPAIRKSEKAACKDYSAYPFLPRNSGSCVLDGSGLSLSNKKAEVDQIHQENVDKLASMSENEILEEQKKLLDMIDPKLVNFIKKKRAEIAKSNVGAQETAKNESFSVMREKKKLEKKISETLQESDLPLRPSKKWVHMDTVETEKLEWMKDLPPPPSAEEAGTGRPARFDFEGNVLAVDIDIPVNMGLHHHGDEPERAGYTLEEIFQLTRSSNLQQKTFAFHTLAKIISKSKSGRLVEKVQSPIIPTILSGGVLMLIRWGLDDTSIAVVAAAVDALHALLWNPLDEEGLDLIWPWYQGDVLAALTPTATLEKENLPEELDEENQEQETDADVSRRDVVQSLVHRMNLLVRIRYILGSMTPQADTVIHLLQILTRLAEHSQAIAYEILKCPGLMDKIVKEFTPTAWSLTATSGPVSNVHGIPVPAAIKLLRVLCQSGRNISFIMVSKYNIKLVLLRYLSVEISELQLPLREAFNLQIEALALWRICATYGLTTDTYFDMFSNIAVYLGQLEKHWLLTPSSLSGHRQFDTHLVCVLEKMLYVAGHIRSMPEESKTNEDFLYQMNWSHVSSLAQPLIACTQKVLSDLGKSYPQQRQDLHFPTVCLNFLASFYSLQGQQSGVDEVTSLEEIEQFCNTCLQPLFASYGFQLIAGQLCAFSNLLAVKESRTEEEGSPSLPSHGVFMVVQSSPNVQESETFKTNMPIMSQHTPYGFLTALLRLALAVCKRHKAMIPKILNSVVKNKDIQMYMKKTCQVSNASQFSTSLFTRPENLLQYFWLKCCILVPCDDMSIAHRVSLNLISRLGHGDEHLVHDLMTSVTFNQAFICEGSSENLTSEAMANLSLGDALHLKSATQEEINVSKSNLLQDVYNSMAKIRGHYLMAFGGMEKAVLSSRNFFNGKPFEIHSLLFKCAGESLMPKDWVYMPLIHVYNKAVQSQNVSGLSASPQSISMVSSVLQWSFALEVWRPAEMSQVPATVRLSRVLCAFIAGNDLFLEKPVNFYLAGLLREFSTQKVLDRLDFEEKIPGMTSFYDLYQEILDHYEAVSFGDPVFGLFVLLPLQQRHSSMLRKAVWGERRKMLRTLRIPLPEILIPIENFLEPEECDIELLSLQLSALLSGAVQSSWSPVLYLVAVHHVNRFLFLTPAADLERSEVKNRMWAQVVVKIDKMTDVIYYKRFNTSQPKGLELYERLPSNRQATLDFHTNKIAFVSLNS